MNLALALQAHLLEWCISRFGNEHFIYCANLVESDSAEINGLKTTMPKLHSLMTFKSLHYFEINRSKSEREL